MALLLALGVWGGFSFREKLMEHYEEISKALNMLEKSKTGSAALSKVQNALQECGCSLKEEELISLLKRLPAVPPPSPSPSMSLAVLGW